MVGTAQSRLCPPYEDRHRSCGGTSFSRAQCAATSSSEYFSFTRLSEGGCLATHTPDRHSFDGLIGRGTKPPPQFGQTLCSLVCAQSAQKVHSYEQIRASVDCGGRSLSQYSQLGRSCRAIARASPDAAASQIIAEKRTPNFPRFAPTRPTYPLPLWERVASMR